MALLVRLILALMLVVQPLPGVAVQRCAEMTRGDGAPVSGAPADDEAPCPCCAGESADASDPACAGGDGASVCRCGMPQPEQPKVPPSESKSDPVPFVASMLPVFLGLVPEGTERPTLAARAIGAPPKRPSNSVHAVLCVWVV